MKTNRLLLGLVCFSCGLHLQSDAAEEYQLTDLGALLGTNSYAQGINNRGEVVGYWRSAEGAHAFLYSGGAIQELGALGPAAHYALSINDWGQVVGFSAASNSVQAFVFNGGALSYLGPLGGLNSYAQGINALAEIVGYVDTPNGARAFLLDQQGLQHLGTLGGADSYAFGINALTQVTGSSSTEGQSGMNAFLWHNGVLVNLNDLIPSVSGWVLQDARGINDKGLIVGWGSLGGQEHAFLFENGTVIDLGILPKGTNSYALGINNSNQVVGGSSTRGGTTHAFLWENGSLRDLNDFLPARAGWELREARGINDWGQIVGWGVFHGQERAFVLAPKEQTLEPSGPAKMAQRFSILSGSSSEPATNSPLADAHVRDGSSASSNFGSATLMELQTSSTSGNNRDVYFKFAIDNAPLPLGSAKLRVFASLAANGSVTTTTFSVADTNWTEGGITWNNRPSLGTAQTNQTFNVKAGASYDIDVTPFIRSEQAAGREIVTLAFHGQNNTSPLANVNSKENASNKPQLFLNTNVFPTVSISSPANGGGFPAPTNLAISVTASDSDGTVTNVEFFADGFRLGADSTSPFSFTWTNAPVGTYALRARAFDDLGAVSTSAVVNITITKNLVPVADAHVKSDTPTTNFGTNTVMEVQTNGASGPTRDTYLRFDLSGVTNVSSANIRIYSSLSGSGTGSGTYYSVADVTWGETNITWNNKPPRSNVLSHVSVSGTSPVWRTNDITSFVLGEKAAGNNLISLALHSQTNSTRFIRINSREADSNRVELVITTTNSAPSAAITTPTNNAVFVAPANVPIAASASDSDGTISQMEFFAGATSLGVDATAPYGLTWNNATPGTNALTVVATDNYGLTKTSAVVNVIVDIAPTVALTAPANGANFPEYPTNITLSSSASDSDGTISKVEFFQGATSVGLDTNSPYSMTWSNVTAGVYALTARATDNLGAVSTSAVVTITVDKLPTVTLTAPTSGSTFSVPSNITVTATASDSDGTVSKVDFYAGTMWIGASQGSPYTITWSNAPAGVFALTATATDDLGGVGTSAAVYVTNLFSPTNLTGLKLWLGADAGVTTNGSGQISQWSDQSGNANHAIQASSPSQPVIITNAINGKPVARFDAVNDFFTFQNNPFSGATQAEAFVILKANTNTSGLGRALWTFGNGPTYYPFSDGTTIWDDFGAPDYQIVGAPSQPLDQYHLYNAAAAAKAWSARINGVLLYSSTNNTVSFSSSPTLGDYLGTRYFGGDVAEVLVYNRPLNDSERDFVGRYLNGRFALMTSPAAPTNLTAKPISSNQVSLAWIATLSNTGVKFVVERKTSVGGPYAVLAVVDGGASFIDGTVAAGTDYFYRVKAANYAGESAYSNEANARPSGGQSAMPLSELLLWLKADAGRSAGNFSGWLDQSGRGNNGIQVTKANQPLAVDGAVNGRPVVRFDAVNDYFGLQNNPFTGVTQAEVFVVLKTTTNTVERVVWTFGNGPTYYPYTDGASIWDAFGSADYQVVGDPAQPLDQYHLYNPAAKLSDWSARINGLLVYSTTNNTPAFNNGSPTIGTYLGTRYFGGDLAEVLVYNRPLIAQEREAVTTYLNEKYNVIGLPTAPVELAAQVLSSSQVALSWRQTGGSTSTVYFVDRRLGTMGDFQELAQIVGTFRYVDEALTPETTYTYRVRNAFSANTDFYSNEVIVQTFSGGQVPLANVVLWLRAEDIGGSDNAQVSTWADFLVPSRTATQTNAADQPLFATAGLNGKPAVGFGGGTYFQLPPVLSNSTAGDIYVVLRSSTNSPISNQGLWKFNATGPTYYPSTSGGVQDAFGSTVLRSLVAPIPDLTAACIYSVATDTNLWRGRINGPVKQLLTTNTVSFSGAPWLGRSTGGAAEPFAGFISEIVVFNRVLSLDEQKALRDSLAQKYGVTLDLPHAPANLTLTRTNTNDFRLSWTALTGSENGFESVIVVERQAGTNGPFVVIEALARTNTAYLDTAALPEVDYGFRLRMINDAGQAVSQTLTAAAVDTDGDGVPDFLEILLGTNPNNADTDGDGLPDGWELRYGLNPLRSDGRHGGAGDFDNDGISNLLEYQQGTDPSDGVVGENPLIRLRVYRPN